MRDDGPVFLEYKIRAVIAIMASQATLVPRRGFVISGGRRLDVFSAGAMARFALHVGKLWRGLDADKTFFAVSERMAADTIAIERPLLLFQCGERVRMARLLPGFVFGLVTPGAGFRKRVRRLPNFSG